MLTPVVPQGKYVDERQIRRWLAEMLLALHYLQTKQVLHRDLKTSNIFLTADNDVQARPCILGNGVALVLLTVIPVAVVHMPVRVCVRAPLTAQAAAACRLATLGWPPFATPRTAAHMTR